ncbi:enoyl-CoA hydratase-related protein [Neobacillus niacini]|uniref:enoyl-CoA hydratase/isomerase family protein n=1 Tax=Neobacillus niacini TaxID=86668 RepID=UPI002FFF715B
MYKTIKLEVSDGIAVLTLDNPKKLNTLNRQTITELYDALDAVESDNNIRVLLTWGGENLFGAGADIGDVVGEAPTAYDGYKFSRKLQVLFNRIENLPIPTIAAMGGYALGGCLEMALAFDIRIASQNAKVGLPELNLGVIPGGGGTQRLPRLIGVGAAKEFMFKGKNVSAQEAYRLGIVNQVVEEGTLLAEGMKLANQFAEKPPIAVAMLKNVINTGISLDINLAMEQEAKSFGLLFSTKDLMEGTTAFKEKRKPKFIGR